MEKSTKSIHGDTAGGQLVRGSISSGCSLTLRGGPQELDMAHGARDSIPSACHRPTSVCRARRIAELGMDLRADLGQWPWEAAPCPHVPLHSPIFGSRPLAEWNDGESAAPKQVGPWETKGQRGEELGKDD
jgi:hypothetical protein